MEAFALYLLKSASWLSGFALVYFVFLQNERFFQLNRFYLVSGILISLFFPLISVHYSIEVPSVASIAPVDFNPAWTNTIPGAQKLISDKPFDYRLTLLLLYLAGVLFFTLRLILNAASLYHKINKSGINKSDQAKLIRASEFPGSFSFFNYIFINPSVSETETEEIMNHELVHISQKHWLDLMFAEVVCLLQWVNPVSWIYTRFIRLNHEYLADEVALQRTSNPAVYKAALVNQLFSTPVIRLSNSFSYSLTGKRFDMMKKIITSPYRKMKVLFVLPVIAIVFYAFAVPEYHYKQPEAVNTLTIYKSPALIAKDVKGTVFKENGEPFPGVTIFVSGSRGVITDASGNFAIANVPVDASLVFSSESYKTQVLKPVFTSGMIVKLVKDPDYKEQGIDSSLVASKALMVIDGVISYERKLPDLWGAKIRPVKGKSATDKYGEKGRYGVIEITTRNCCSVNGTVVQEDGNPLQGVFINVSTELVRAVTNANGHFLINNVPENALLVFSLEGFKPQVLKAVFNSDMTVILLKDQDNKEQVIRIRPVTPEDFSSPASKYNPLIIIDGVVSNLGMGMINPDEISSIRILKDESATSVYGERGKNGVILITTKKKAQEAGQRKPAEIKEP